MEIVFVKDPCNSLKLQIFTIVQRKLNKLHQDRVKKLFLPHLDNVETGAEGLEPTNGGTKTRSLTTWRRPNKSKKYKNLWV